MKTYIGIDISAESFTTAMVDTKSKSGYRIQDWRYQNQEDLVVFMQALSAEHHHLVMEATGVYHLGLAYALVEAGFSVSVVNPLSVKHFTRMKLSRTKTDQQDAVMLCAYGQQQASSLGLFEVPTQTLDQLRQRRMWLRNLQNQLQIAQNQLHTLAHHPRADQLTVELLKEEVAMKKEQIKQVQALIETLVNQDFAKQKQLLLTIPGFGETLTSVFIEVVSGFVLTNTVDDAKTFGKFVGLSPSEHQSGSSVRGNNSITRTGAPMLRQKMYLPAVTLCTRTKNENVFKSFYLRLRQKGKAFKEAIVAVMHKMCTVALAVLRNNHAYDSAIHQNQILF